MIQYLIYATFISYGACFLSGARLIWFMGTCLYYERQQATRRGVIDRLEREIVIQRFKCAAANPEAAAILTEREAARTRRIDLTDHLAYRRFFDRDLGGEMREHVLTEEEAEAVRKANG